jgi:murein DD-endopeptidase MepM/ murein hydrolase activator NlpD
MQIPIFLILLILLVVPAAAQVASPLQQVSMNQEIESSKYTEDTTSVEYIIEEWIENLVIDPKLRINERLSIDCVWVNQHSYFSHWTSGKINPYKLDGAKYNDTLSVHINDTLATVNWSLPVADTRITSPFGFRRYRWHYGTDLKVYYGDSIAAAFDGIVRIVDYERYGYGRYVVLRHLNGFETLYGHLSKAKVKVGETVKAGELVGLGGSTGRSTGTHLHFEVRYQGNAIDPSSIYDFTSDCLLVDTYSITPASFQYLVDARKIRYHKIRGGDTLGHISQRYGVSVGRLCSLNRISRRTTLRIGRRLRIN